MTYPKYFIQTSLWAQFWKEASLPGHNFFELGKSPNIVIVYQYPWQLGHNFLYIPKTAYFNQEIHTELLQLAQRLRSSFIKIDFDDQYKDFSSVTQLPGAKISKKTLQFMQTMTLDTSTIVTYPDEGVIDWKLFFSKNVANFWSHTNQNIRRYTKKSCEQGWVVSTEKSLSNFEAFWSVYSETKDRQQFAIQPRSYLEHLFRQDFSRIIILRDSLGIPQCVWLGLSTEHTLTYLAGGNSAYSFDHYGQYLAHLVATHIAGSEKLSFYDLGGYNPDLGFGKFKEGYRGIIRVFQGPIDIITRPLVFRLISSLIAITKKIQRHTKE
jgi:lipid II:glycine glycyltransferase (peptidoglycan interpeptide bridge formation enzyme)